MNKIILATASTDNYINNIIPYLKSIQLNSNFDYNILVTLDCYYSDMTLTKVHSCFLSNNLIESKSPINCLQHGEFLKAKIFEQFDDDDYVCFTDGDIIMQRGLFDNEKISILNLRDDEIMVQYNAGPNDNLFDESFRLGPKISLSLDFSKYKCYNTGMIICNIRTWKKLLLEYNIRYKIYEHYFSHYAKQQWIISYIIEEILKPNIVDYSLHTHYHHGYVDNTHIIDGIIYYREIPILFAHNISPYKRSSKSDFINFQHNYIHRYYES